MALFASVGTTIGYSASLPATVDASGYGNLSFTDIAQVESAPEVGVSVNTGNFLPLGTGEIEYYKTTTDHSSITIPVAFSDDAGLAAMRTARDAKVPYSFEVAYDDAPSGGTASARYFQGLVTGVMETPGGADGIIMANIMIQPQPSTYVEVAAAEA